MMAPKPTPFMTHGDTTQYVTIPLSEYNDLLDSDKFLLALEAAGVDNWGGYDRAKEIYYEEK
jgi:hypothetical protein